MSFTSSTFLVKVTAFFWPVLSLIWYIWILAFQPHLDYVVIGLGLGLGLELVSTLFRLVGGSVDLNTNTFLLAPERNFEIFRSAKTSD